MSGTMLGGMTGMGSNGMGVGGPQQSVSPGLMALIAQMHAQQGQQGQGGQQGPQGMSPPQGMPTQGVAPQLPQGVSGQQPGMMQHTMMPQGQGMPQGAPQGMGQQPVQMPTPQSAQQFASLLAQLKGSQNGISPTPAPNAGQTAMPQGNPQQGYLAQLLQHIQGQQQPQVQGAGPYGTVGG